jgi:hypothetical protein
MTPISRLIPRSSGDNKIHRSEMETSRTSSSMVGSGSVPPMTPGSVIDARHMDDVRGDDLVSEILRDVENSSPIPRHHPQMSNGGGGVPGGMGGRGGEVEADPMMTQFHPSQYQDPPQEYYQERRQFIGRRGGNGEYEDEEDDRPPIQEIKTRSSEDTDFIGMILDEMKMPLIVAILILGVGSSGLDESLGKIVPWIVNDGKMGIIGLILKAIVGGLVFYALKRIFL